MIPLVELSAKQVAFHIPFEVVEKVYPPVPEQLQLRIAYWSFPENEEDIRWEQWCAIWLSCQLRRVKGQVQWLLIHVSYGMFPDFLKKRKIYSQWSESPCTLTRNHQILFLNKNEFISFFLQQLEDCFVVCIDFTVFDLEVDALEQKAYLQTSWGKEQSCYRQLVEHKVCDCTIYNNEPILSLNAAPLVPHLKLKAFYTSLCMQGLLNLCCALSSVSQGHNGRSKVSPLSDTSGGSNGAESTVYKWSEACGTVGQWNHSHMHSHATPLGANYCLTLVKCDLSILNTATFPIIAIITINYNNPNYCSFYLFFYFFPLKWLLLFKTLYLYIIFIGCNFIIKV